MMNIDVTQPTTIPINKLAGNSFYVEDYQRGYKWSVQQVIDLLVDINEFEEKGDFYCLQPLALIDLGNKKYEVIDGQQRLSTIFIILSIIDSPIYEITYKTRASSEDFLKNVKELNAISTLDFHPTNENIDQTEQAIIELWKDYIENNKNLDNTDNFHFFMAFITVKNWFKNCNINSTLFLKKLKQDTRFIWYVESNESDPKIVFRNLNSGKIALTNAELIKANFINTLKDENREIQKLRQNELAAEWDKIEQELHHDSFWFFINNSTDKERYETRIDLLFELMVDKQPKNNSDKLYTYRKFTQTNNEREFAYSWENVILYFYQLKEWYEDNELYHLIGYIVYTDVKTIRDILEMSREKGKEEFRLELITAIQKYFEKFIKNSKSDLDYLEILDYHDSYKQLTNTLLLYNIEIYIISNAHYRFPFDLYKNQQWSLEHIHAQKTEDLRKVSEVKIWLEEIEKLYDELIKTGDDEDQESFPSSDLQSIKQAIQESEDNNTLDITDSMQKQIIIFNESIVKYFKLDSIKNMALLDGATNSSFSNKAFGKKRDALIDIDRKKWSLDDGKKKPFIPIGTKNVFMKYTSSDISQMNFWGWKDRLEYYKHIEEVLDVYLPVKGSAND